MKTFWRRVLAAEHRRMTEVTRKPRADERAALRGGGASDGVTPARPEGPELDVSPRLGRSGISHEGKTLWTPRRTPKPTRTPPRRTRGRPTTHGRPASALDGGRRERFARLEGRCESAQCELLVE
eukprot:7249741-Prymnesium_polylepis.1